MPASSRRRTRTTGSTRSKPLAAALAGRRRRPVDRHAVRSAAAGRASPRWRRRTPSAATRRRSASPRCREAAARLDRAAASASTSPPAQIGRVRRHQGVRRHAAAVAAAAHARPRHRAVPGGRLPDLRDGRDPRRLPRRCPCRSTTDWRLDLDAIDADDAARALCLWVNARATRPARSTTSARRRRGAAAHGVPVFSDECYVEFTWDGPAAHDPRARRSTAWSPCTRCRSARTWPACGSASTPATPSSSHYLQEVRKHVGLMVPGPVQAAGVAALDDDEHVDVQRDRYRRRLERLGRRCSAWSGVDVAAARRRLLPVVRRRRRLGVRRAAGPRGRRAGEPRRVLRCGWCAERARRRGAT